MRSDNLCPIDQMDSHDVRQVGKIVKDLSGNQCFCLFGARTKVEKEMELVLEYGTLSPIPTDNVRGMTWEGFQVSDNPLCYLGC